jgi:asparagine synthase (glutamine-hydrolysing)
VPGLAGFVAVGLERDRVLRRATEMRDLITAPRVNVSDQLFCDDVVCATRVGSGTLPVPEQPASHDGLHVWFDGEVFNGRSVAGPEATSDAESLRRLFADGEPDLARIAELDGVWAAVVYDDRRRRVHLLVDRLGLRIFFWTLVDGRLAWCSQLAGFLAVPGFDPLIDRRAVDEVFAAGHPLGDRTLFDGVSLVSPGSVVTVDLDSGALEKRRYWWWDRIDLERPAPTEAEAAATLVELLREAVAARCRGGDERLGVSLSGGLDSRALVAALPDGLAPPAMVTFGQRNCLDILIAREVARLAGAAHHVWEITPDNWLEPRFAGVWWADGQFNLINQHGIEAGELFRSVCDVSLDGFMGDVLTGGMYLDKLADPDRFDREGLARFMKCSPDLLGDTAAYEALGRNDFYMLENRARRLNNVGTRHMQVFLEDRKPFAANALVEYLLTLPPHMRAHGRLYRAALLAGFPRYFGGIAWQKTTLTIDASAAQVRFAKWRRRLQNRLGKRVRATGVDGRGPWWYTDYERWLRREPVRGTVDRLLRDPEALFLDFAPARECLSKWDDELRGKKLSKEVGLLLTFEIWLQQVYGGRFRPHAGVAPAMGGEIAVPGSADGKGV